MSDQPIPSYVPEPAAPLATIATLGQHEGQSVTLRGWLYNLRESGKLLFPIFRDGTGTVQGVAHVKSRPARTSSKPSKASPRSPPSSSPARSAPTSAPPAASSSMSKTSRSSSASPSPTPTPSRLKEHGVDFLMEHRHLWVRSPRQSAILRIRAEIMRAAAEYFDTNGFIRTDPPILTPAACEGTSTLFPVDYFGDPAYLTQSGQLYIESTALALGKVYSFGPTFRAEKSKTRRHLTEFWMIEPEVAYCDLDGLMELAENFLSHIVQSVLKNRASELSRHRPRPRKLEPHPPALPAPPLRRSRQDAQRGPPSGELEQPFEYGNDFGSPDETWLSSQFDQPVMVHRYPAAVKAFYMEPDPDDPTLALCVDVLAPEGYGEIIGGSQRVASYELLKPRIEQHNLPARSLPVVPRPAPLRLRPPRRLRHGHRARCSLGLRPRPRPRNHPLRPNPPPHLSLTTAPPPPRRHHHAATTTPPPPLAHPQLPSS